MRGIDAKDDEVWEFWTSWDRAEFFHFLNSVDNGSEFLDTDVGIWIRHGRELELVNRLRIIFEQRETGTSAGFEVGVGSIGCHEGHCFDFLKRFGMGSRRLFGGATFVQVEQGLELRARDFDVGVPIFLFGRDGIGDGGNLFVLGVSVNRESKNSALP